MAEERPDANRPAIAPPEDRLCGVPVRRNPSSRKLGKDVLPVARTVFVSIPPRDALGSGHESGPAGPADVRVGAKETLQSMNGNTRRANRRIRALTMFWAAGFIFLRGTGAGATNGATQTVQVVAGELEAVFHAAGDGIHFERLGDRSTATTLATNIAPFFTLTLTNTATREHRIMSAAEGWDDVSVRVTRDHLRLRWMGLSSEGRAGVRVTAAAELDQRASALRWTLRIDNQSAAWAVRQVAFPQLAVPELAPQAAVLFPRGPGEVQYGLWQRAFTYHGNYPDGWCAMQFLAAYREGEQAVGLYLGYHDPQGGTKRIEVASEPSNRVVRLTFTLPASDFHRAGNHFDSHGEVVWQLLRGDWFDAAMIYKDWARQNARWWPRLTAHGREDTPLWMRELSAWVMTGGAPAGCVPAVTRFREAIQMPIGFHWYNWHQIPFDNDYPHYFPTKTNFAAAVAELQRAGVFVMPYINGRLWDTHDRGAEDATFTSLALPAATKQEDGQPFVEIYGSKETNGEPVRLAVMCPTTRLWQDKVQAIVLRLLREEGTRGVYIDQIAAAPPTLCMDASHGHPLGGGHWWASGYWDLLDGIRRQMPSDCMLTSECNAEPFIRWFDGYLTWHWQFDAQVPVFPAIYGGTIQMFGRAYRGGATRDLALRMKAGQQLVFGEQIGWFDPGPAMEPQNLPFLRKLIQTRALFRRYFYAGEMARPPRLAGPIPTVKADWQWSGEWWVTTDAVLTGAWRLPAEQRVLMLFVNVSDQTVSAAWPYDQQAYGLGNQPCRLAISRDGHPATDAGRFSDELTQNLKFPPQSVQAWEFTPAR